MDLSLDYSYPYSFTTFGDLLKYLRRRQRLTQLELSITVGYSEAQISRLEKNLRLPDLTALKALFFPALHLEDDPQLATRFMELAQTARREDAPAPGIAPYKGLLYFDESDSELFFGREALTARLVGHVMDLARGTSIRFLTVVGASGSGKSSLVRAGLAVALKRAGWEVMVFTPTPIPIWVMETSLNKSRIESAERVLIIVDQFEELFTLCHDEMERIKFIDQLISLAQGNSKKITVVIALRADFYSHCAHYPLLRRAISEEQEYIGQMTHRELRRAIEEPARYGGWEFEPGLVDLLLNEIGAHGSHEPESGALPLLSHALLATWERRRGRTFTLDGYYASGGVHGAIAETAESVFTDLLNQEQQGIARDVFLRLTELGEGTEDTRRRAALKELVRYPEEATQLRAVLDTLADARLITLNEDSAEVAHEALIREWQRLREWLTKDREGLLLHRHLTASAHDWEARGRDPSELYRGARLAQVREWALTLTNEERLNALERAFLAASIEQEEHDSIERETQHKRELEAAQKLAETQSSAARQLRRRAIILTGALTLIMILAGVALFFWKQANRIALEARSRELASAAISNLDDDPERSILLALQAESITHTLDAENALHRSILASRVMLVLHHDAEVWSVAYSPDGKRIATASQDKTAKIWNATTGELLLTLKGHTASVNGIVYSPDGKRIATASDDHTARVWDATTGKELFTLSGHTDWVYRIAFSPDGARLVTTSNDKTARVWDAQTEKELLTFIRHGDVVFDAAFSPDGKRIATCGFDGTVRIWDSSSGEELLVLPIERELLIKMAPHGVAFSPDGVYVAVTSNGVGVKMWDATTGKLVLSNNPGSSQELLDITFNSDGKLAATADFDKKAEVWSTITGQVLYTLSGHSDVINGVAFSPDGTRLATASWDHTVRVWDINEVRESLFIPIPAHWSKYISYSPDGTRIITDYRTENTAKIWDAISGNELAVLSAPTGQIVAAVYSPDGKTIAAAYNDKSIVIWDAKTGNYVATLVGHTGNVSWGSFSSDGSRLASGSNDGEIFIWDVASGKVIRTLQGPIPSSSPATTDYTITSLAFSPDDNRLISGDTNGFGTIWDVNTGEKLIIISPQAGSLRDAYIPEVVSSVAYSPDGMYVAVTSDRGVIKILNASTGKDLLSWNDHNTGVSSVMFSPDGKQIATASQDGTAKVWNVSTGNNLLTLPVPGASFISFSPDGKRLAVGGESGVYIFVLPIEDLVALAKSRLTRTLTTEECRRYLHVEICPAEP